MTQLKQLAVAKPLEGARIAVVGAKANSEITDSNGAFVLKFPTEVRVGDLVRVHIEMEGYVPYTDTIAVVPS